MPLMKSCEFLSSCWL